MTTITGMDSFDKKNRDKQIRGNKNNDQSLHIQKNRNLCLFVVGVHCDFSGFFYIATYENKSEVRQLSGSTFFDQKHGKEQNDSEHEIRCKIYTTSLVLTIVQYCKITSIEWNVF